MGESLVSLVVPSCDKYHACWAPLFASLDKYWPDCSFPKVLVTNQRAPAIHGVATIQLGKDYDWSTNLLLALDRIDTPFVLLLVEDGWFGSKVDSAPLADFIEVLRAGKADYLRLRPIPGPDADLPENTRLGIISTDAPYRTSAPFSIWRKEVLRETLRAGETAWQFELTAGPRTRKYGARFLSTKPTEETGSGYCLTREINAVVRGKWTFEARAYAEKEGMRVEFGAMPMESGWEHFCRTTYVGRQFILLGMAIRRPDKAVRYLYRKLRAVST